MASHGQERIDTYMNFQLMASMMCADYSNLRKEVEALDTGGIDSFHIDIMDGRYVPNYAMSLNDMRCIRSLTDKPLDVYLMVEHPNNTIKIFINSLRPGDTIIHTPGGRVPSVCDFAENHQCWAHTRHSHQSWYQLRNCP